jgi:hypothetical protein
MFSFLNRTKGFRSRNRTNNFVCRKHDFLNQTILSRANTNNFLRSTDDFRSRTNDWLSLTNDFVYRTNDFLSHTIDFLKFYKRLFKIVQTPSCRANDLLNRTNDYKRLSRMNDNRSCTHDF